MATPTVLCGLWCATEQVVQGQSVCGLKRLDTANICHSCSVVYAMPSLVVPYVL